MLFALCEGASAGYKGKYRADGYSVNIGKNIRCRGAFQRVFAGSCKHKFVSFCIGQSHGVAVFLNCLNIIPGASADIIGFTVKFFAIFSNIGIVLHIRGQCAEQISDSQSCRIFFGIANNHTDRVQFLFFRYLRVHFPCLLRTDVVLKFGSFALQRVHTPSL